MDNTILENLIKTIIPQLIIIFATNIITRYFQKQPNEKLEISYNRIYYPLFKIIMNNKGKKDDEIDYIKVRDELKLRLDKYHKYADRTTINAFNQFDLSIKNNHQKQTIRIYKNIIYDNIVGENCKLRKILGYPEPSIFKNYIYLSNKNKLYFNYAIIMIVFSITVEIALVFSNYSKIQCYCYKIVNVLVIIFIINAILHLIYHISNWIVNKRAGE